MTMVEHVARAMYGEAALINAREMEEDYPRVALEGVNQLRRCAITLAYNSQMA